MSNPAVASATWARPRSQLVPPPVVTPLIRLFTVVTPSGELTDVSGRFWLFVALAGASLAKVNRATSEGVPPAKPFKVGLLTPGSITDGGWNALAWEGVQRIKNELGAEISHQETKTPAEMEEGFRAFGQREFDLAFGHGFEYQDPAKSAGAQHPKTIFITTSGSTVAANVAPMRFQIEEDQRA